MYRTDIINFLILNNNFKNYLEIGVKNPNHNFNKIVCYKKIGVDPDLNSEATFIETSDDFFAKNKENFDIIFIDGLHLAEQVLKDIDNSLKILNEDGIIVCHDCLPNSQQEQVEDYDGVSAWTGTVWKAIAHLRMTREDINIRVVDTDYGCGIITKQKQICFPETKMSDMNWEFFSKNRNELMNVVSVEKFRELYSGE